MGFTNNSTWSHSAEKNSTLGTYYNDTGTTAYISSITAYLGTGTGSFTNSNGTTSRGYGYTINAYLTLNGVASGTVAITTPVAASGGYATVASCTAYTFSWSTPVSVPAGSTYNIRILWSDSSTVLCYARKTPMTGVVKTNYTVSYNSNGGSGSMDSHSVTTGSSVTLRDNSFTAPKATTNNYTITRNGNGGNSLSALTCTVTTTKTFRRWRAGSTSGAAYSEGASFTPSNDTVMYAEWKSTTTGGVQLGSTTRGSTSRNGYTVTFNGNGGTATKAS